MDLRCARLCPQLQKSEKSIHKRNLPKEISHALQQRKAHHVGAQLPSPQ
jgi:hypothetical protein